jgi:hypothetical protein
MSIKKRYQLALKISNISFYSIRGVSINVVV